MSAGHIHGEWFSRSQEEKLLMLVVALTLGRWSHRDLNTMLSVIGNATLPELL